MPGDVITYTIKVTNSGTVALTNIIVTDELVPTFKETINSLEPGASEECVVEYKVTQTDVDTKATITNVAIATTDDVTNEDTDSTIETDKTADFTISKDSKLNKKEGNTSEKAEVGDTITYTITVKNIGSITLKDIHVVDNMIAVDENVTLESGETKIITKDYTVKVEDIENAAKGEGVLLNKVTATYGDKTEEDDTTTEARTEYNYIVEYYKDGETEPFETSEQFTAEFGSQITVVDLETNRPDGYRLDKTENLPLTITSNPSNNVIKVYYVKDNFTYTVEYYKDGSAQPFVTSEPFTAEFGSQITVVDTETNRPDGYKVDKTENLPLTITSNPSNNVIKVYYVKDIFGYTVEYYYQGNQDNSKTETLSAEFGAIITQYPTKQEDGYRLDNEVNLPLTITSNPKNNVIKIYYVKDNFGYTVEYYKDGATQPFETSEGLTAEFGSQITTVDLETN